jgi:hypothetical protein
MLQYRIRLNIAATKDNGGAFFSQPPGNTGETTSTLPNFLDLHDSDFQFIDRYRVLFEAETAALAHDFYDHALAKVSTSRLWCAHKMLPLANRTIPRICIG